MNLKFKIWEQNYKIGKHKLLQKFKFKKRFVNFITFLKIKIFYINKTTYKIHMQITWKILQLYIFYIWNVLQINKSLTPQMVN